MASAPVSPPAKNVTPEEEAKAKELLQSLMTGDKKTEELVSELQQPQQDVRVSFPPLTDFLRAGTGAFTNHTRW